MLLHFTGEERDGKFHNLSKVACSRGARILIQFCLPVLSGLFPLEYSGEEARARWISQWRPRGSRLQSQSPMARAGGVREGGSAKEDFLREVVLRLRTGCGRMCHVMLALGKNEFV
jgi:hypothetical protein